jgi:secondary thiamine-phosphate synthase enzyme
MVITVKTGSRTEMLDITTRIQAAVSTAGMTQGLCMVYVPHTTAGVTINENADPSVKRDIMMVLNQVIPWEADYRHLEGNSPAHIKSSLIGASETIIVKDNNLVLGTWQGIFFCEFDGPRSRKVHIKLISG